MHFLDTWMVNLKLASSDMWFIEVQPLNSDVKSQKKQKIQNILHAMSLYPDLRATMQGYLNAFTLLHKNNLEVLI